MVDVMAQIADADLVKIDIEGGEWMLLEDPRFADSPPGALVFEYHPRFCPSGDPRERAESLLAAAGLSAQRDLASIRRSRDALGVAELSSSEAAASAEADPSAADRSSADILDSREAGGMIIRGGGLRFGGYVGVVALSVLSASLLTRHLGPVRFGEYTTVLSLVAVFAAITDAGMSAIGTREYAVREGAAREELMRDLLGLRMLLTLVGVVCVLAFALAAGYDRGPARRRGAREPGHGRAGRAAHLHDPARPRRCGSAC